VDHEVDGREEKRTRASSVLAQTCALIAAALGFAALLGRLLGLSQPGRIDSRWVSMAPSTALLLALFGAALFASARRPGERAVRRAAMGVAIAVAASALALLAFRWLGIHAQVEHLGMSPAGAAGYLDIGHMSPLTAACFVLAAASLAACLPAPQRSRARVGFWLAGLVTAAGTFSLLAGVLGEPLLYSGDSVPPAATASFAFVALGISLMVLAAPRAWPLDGEIDAASRRFARVLVLVFAAFTSGLIALGYWYVKDHEAQYRKQAGRELSAIADLKAGELALWRAERLADAQALTRGGELAGLARRALANPRDPRVQKELEGWMLRLREAYRYSHIFLADVRGLVRMSVPRQTHAPDSIVQTVAEARPDRIAFLDFHRDAPEAPIHLSVSVPIRDEANGGIALGWLYLAIDPAQSLYALLQRWPTHSRTAETFLVRRDGDDVLFLSELLFRENAALALRIPLANTDVPAVKAVLGEEGIVEGNDYGGPPVIASLRKVPDSPWFLVSRMEAAEALAPVRENLWLTVALVGALLFAAAAAVGFAWRHQRARHYQERVRAGDELAASTALHRAVTQNATDAIITADAAGRICGWNPAATRIFGYAEAEMLGQPLSMLMPERFRELHQSGMRRLAGGGELRALFKTVELHGLTKEGNEFSLELSRSQWHSREGVYFTGIIRDITERKRAEMALARRNDLYNLLSQTNQAIVRLTSREELFPRACRYAVEYGRFLFAWIGTVNAENGRILPVAQYGEDQGYVEGLRRAARQSDPAGWSGPLGQALRTGARVVSNDFLNDPLAAPWHQEARRAGVRGAAAFPIREGDAVAGVICLYFGEAGYFSEDLLLTLDEMARDLSFALTVYKHEAERRRAQYELRESESSLREAQKIGRLGSLVFDIPAGVWRSSAMLDTIFGIGADHPRTTADWAQLIHPSEREQVLSYMHDIVATQQPFEREYRIVRTNDGAERWVFGLGRVEYGADGAPLRMLGTVQDVTERKRLEEAHLQAQKLESLGTLAGGIAHDFNNILAAINGNADLAAEDVGPDHAAAESLEEIRKASARASELVRRIMAFGRPKEARQGVVELGAVMSEVLKLLRSTLPAGIALRTEFARNTPRVLADAAQVHEVIVNLTTNAAYAIGRRAGTILYRLEPVQVGEKHELRIPGLAEGRYARLTVTDSGCGMDAATQERIFDAFYTTKPVGEGTGLGLSMVHGIMRSHGGLVTVDSAPGKGSSFALYFPAAQDTAQVKEQIASAQILPCPGQRLLYVDDEEALVFLADRVLSRLGHKFSGYTDPEAALKVFRAHPQDYDVVVTDLSMPHMSGFELAREVLALRPGMPVLMTTGYIRAEDEESARAAGIREIVLKPVTVDEMGQVLDRVIRNSQTRG
jgi:PAS domain S-box-containing protein